MTQLAINVDHVATLRQARAITEPDPVLAAGICELAGASGIVVHLREDRRHIQDRDVRILRETVKTKLNLEMGATPEIISIALNIKPDMITLVPEKRQELTTEGGLNVTGQKKRLAGVIAQMEKGGIPVSLFIDPDPKQIKTAAEIWRGHLWKSTPAVTAMLPVQPSGNTNSNWWQRQRTRPSRLASPSCRPWPELSKTSAGWRHWIPFTN